MRQLEHEETVRKIEVLGKDIVEAEVKLADAKRGREEEEEGGNGDGGEEGEKPMTRAAKMARRSELVKSVAEKTAELDKLKENDPQAIADLEKELKLVTEAATRWTDNVFACQEYMVKKRGMVKKEVNKMIGITDAFDYPDSK